MGSFEIGVCLPVLQYGPDRVTPRWSEISRVAINAEQMGMDTLWIPDELLWRSNTPSPIGFWDGVSMAGAAAAITSRIKIGSWVLSALHRNPGIIAKTAETLDEISGGRFVFGLGAGHAGTQAHSFGLPEDMVSARFEEALQVIVPLMRGGKANFEGKYHSARDLVQQPVGPRPGKIPLLIGGQKAKGIRYAALNADIWSTYARSIRPSRSSVLEWRYSTRSVRRSNANPRRSGEQRACRFIRSRPPETATKTSQALPSR